MSTFSGKNINATYQSILNIGDSDNDVLTAGSICKVRDSLGTCSALSLGIVGEGVCIGGSSTVDGNITVIGTAQISSTLASGGATVNGNANISGDVTLGSSNSDFVVSCGDFYVGGSTGAGNRCVSVDGVTGNTDIKGSLSVGAACTSTDIALSVCGTAVVQGEIRSCADIIAYYSSDCRLKTDLNTICNTQSIVSGLTGYSFEWNDKSDKEGTDLGIMAQDVQKVLPSIVKQRDNGYLAVDYIKLIPVLIEEVKRLNTEVETLKNAQSF
jgi:hypothetical protein